MFQKILDRFVGDWEDTPNKFTIVMGDKIRKSRKIQKLSQAELAKSIYVRQASISEMENGKRVVNSIELVYLSLALEKPIMYFFPEDSIKEIEHKQPSPILQELILQAQRLSIDDLKKLIAQARVIADME